MQRSHPLKSSLCILILNATRKAMLWAVLPLLIVFKMGNSKISAIRMLWGRKLYELCFSLNKKPPIYGREKLNTMLQAKHVDMQQKMKIILEDKYFAMTTDSWTSTANHGYVSCTEKFYQQGHLDFAFSYFRIFSERWGIHCSRHSCLCGKLDASL